MIAPPRPPSHDELEALIKEARERQLRRRLLGAAGVAIATAFGLSVFAFVTGGNPTNLGAGLATAGGSTGPRCRASQLSTIVGFQGATQTLVGGADVKNVGGRACSLPGTWPHVRIWSEGKRLPVLQRRPPGYHRFAVRPARVLVPGGVAVLEMQWANWCGTPRTPKAVRFEIRLGRGLAVAADEAAVPRCISANYGSTIIVDRPRQRS